MEDYIKENNSIIICPIITFWLIFAFQFIFCVFAILIFPLYNSDIIKTSDYIIQRLGKVDLLIFLEMLFINIFLLVISILVTLSIERKKYFLYKLSIILTIIYEIIITPLFLVTFLLTFRYVEHIFIFIFSVLTEYTLLLVLLLYKNKIKDSELITKRLSLNLLEENK